MMAVNVYHACIVGIFTTRLRRLFVCGPRRAKNNSSCAAFRCAMAHERDRAPQIRTTGNTNTILGGWGHIFPWHPEGEGRYRQPKNHDVW